MVAKDKNNTIESYITKYTNKIEIYSLGITIIKLLKFIKFDVKDKKINQFLRNIIHPDFEKRYSAKEAITHLKQLIR